jgi:hypothetical protein
MKSTDFIVESIGEDADEMHRDHEVQMARADCYHAAKYAIELHKMLHKISEEQGLEGWVQEKLTLACDYLRTVHEHMQHADAMEQELAMPAFTFEGAEEDFKKKLDEVNPHNYDSDEDYYNDLNGSGSGDSGDFDPDAEDDFEPEDEPESHYEKHVRVHGLGEGDVVDFPTKKPKADDVGIVRRIPKKQPTITSPIKNVSLIRKKNTVSAPSMHSIYEGEDEELFGHSEKAELYTAVRNMRRGGETSGASANGFVRTTYQQLVDTFGEPEFGPNGESGDGKVTCYWAITFGDKNRTVATIYDWKTYDGTPMHEYDWHIGGKHGSRASDFVEAALKFKQGVSEEGGGGYPATPKYKVGDTVCVRGYQGSGKIAFIKDRNDVGVIFDHPQKGLKVKTTIDKLLPKQGVSEEGKGLWANIHAKQERIKHGSHERMRKPGSKGAPSKQDFVDSQKTSKNESNAMEDKLRNQLAEMTAGGCSAGGFATGATGGKGYKPTTGVPKKIKNVVKPKNMQLGKGIY